jgi:hypothetical protein
MMPTLYKVEVELRGCIWLESTSEHEAEEEVRQDFIAMDGLTIEMLNAQTTEMVEKR